MHSTIICLFFYYYFVGRNKEVGGLDIKYFLEINLYFLRKFYIPN